MEKIGRRARVLKQYLLDPTGLSVEAGRKAEWIEKSMFGLGRDY